MEQNKTDQILEVLLARMDADKAESKAERKADKAEMKASQEEMMARMEAKMDNNKEEMKYAINSLSGLHWEGQSRRGWR
jgi:hypothetical protein